MDCCNNQCSNLALENKVCRKCYMKIYCSEDCKQTDWANGHKNQCKSEGFTQNDFIPIVGEKILGKGSYGEVILATYRQTGELYALKEIKKYPKSRSLSIKSLFREISIHKRLIHPNVVRLYGYYETIESVVLVLEYADNGNLYTHLKKKVRLPEREAHHYFYDICQGIKYLHDNNIIHRDLKPENVLLFKKGLAKICDFGWCVMSTGERNTYCGTLDYMAPEILQGASYSNKVDIWSLGVLLYEVLQGITPFNGKNHSERLKKMDITNVSFNFSTSQAAKKLIKNLLSKSPQDRPNIKEIVENEWILRYSGIIRPGSLMMNSIDGDLEKDEYDVKISKNYPASYKKNTGFSSRLYRQKQSMVTLSRDFYDKNDANSNETSFIEQRNNRIISSMISNDDLLNKQKELERLQREIERSNVRKKPRSLFSKFINAIGLG